MPEGTAIPRHFVLVTQDGEIVIDWGNKKYQNISSGDVIKLKSDNIAYPIKEPELVWLKNNGIINDYDQFSVYVYNLPDVKIDN
jgi:hypothetical protein